MKQDLKTNDQPAVGKEEEKTAGEKVPEQFPFPRNSLKEALAVPRAIEHDNAGKPYDTTHLAKQSFNTTPRSSSFEVLLTSSERYGLTVGSSRAKAISLTAEGDAIVASSDESIRAANIRRALLTPKVFEEFFARYDGKILPSEEILKVVLEQEFQIPKPYVYECYEVLMKNITDYDLLLAFGDSRTVYLGKLMKQAGMPQPPVVEPTAEQPPVVQPPVDQPPGVQPPGVQPPVAGPKKGDEKWGGLTDLLPTSGPPVPVATPPPEPAKIDVKVPRVFISHCKNKNILRQIKQMLDQGKVDRVISEEKETGATPLSDRVSGLMWDCNCAIINITVDDEKKEEETLEINENVFAEVWGAYLHYKKRVILVIDRRLKDKLPNSMQGLTAIFYERNQISWTDGVRLQNALNEFRDQL
ncbi:MAG: hypothetical protein E6K99_06685 [Thaumarchaeota archaeon]|nr:MAG: hypothetical protein E6K99_06685 [Nitrososphaerota archaeon]